MTQTADPLQRSEVECRRFGLEVYRGRFVDEVPVREITGQILRDGGDVAILRVPAAKAGVAGRIEARGFPTLVADTLVYYRCDLDRVQPNRKRNPGLEIEPLSADSVGALDSIVASSFAMYANHYTANPLLAGGLVPGYQEWARSFVTPGDPRRLGWIARRDGVDIGFMTCSRDGLEAEIVLNAVVPEAAGGGVYGDLVRHAQRYFAEAGCRVLRVSTQAHNVAVQKVWSREGFGLDVVLTTVHVNSLLSASVVPKRTLPLVVTPDDFAESGRVSDDDSPASVDEESVEKEKIGGRISDGLTASAVLSRHYRTEFPGPGTVVAGFRSSLRHPLHPGREYTVEISFPFHDPEHGRWTSLARVVDMAGETCLLAYSDLVNREVSAP